MSVVAERFHRHHFPKILCAIFYSLKHEEEAATVEKVFPLIHQIVHKLNGSALLLNDNKELILLLLPKESYNT